VGDHLVFQRQCAVIACNGKLHMCSSYNT
jgi:hypothetical protein